MGAREFVSERAKNRMVFSEARLVRVSCYESSNRLYNSQIVHRHAFRWRDMILVYSGGPLGLKAGAVVELKGTVKRLDVYSGKEFVRISRPKILSKYPLAMALENDYVCGVRKGEQK